MDVVLSHVYADFDSVGALVGAGLLYPEAALVLPGGEAPSVRKFLALHRDVLPIRSLREVNPEAIRRIVVVDACARRRLGEAAAWLERPGVEIHLWDHHPEAGCDIPATLRRIEPWGAASTLLVHELRARGIVPPPIPATALLLGIHEDTGSLTHAGTRPEDAEAVAWLLRQGAALEGVAEYLRGALAPEQRRLLHTLLANAETHRIAGLEVVLATAPPGPFVEDAALLASRLLEAEQAAAALLLLPMDGRLFLIGRSATDALDLGAAFRELGGGGHPRAASAALGPLPIPEVRARLLDALARHARPEPVARQIMSAPVRTVPPDAPIAEARRRMLRYGHAGLPVVEEGRLVGIVTRRDVDRARHHRLEHAPVRSIMTREVQTASPETPLSELERRMVESGIGRLPILEDGRLVGIVTRTDLLRALHGARYLAGAPRPEEESAARRLREGLPAAVQRILEAVGRVAEAEGSRVYAVGGFVRDLLLGVRNLDVDLLVEPDGIALARAVVRELGGELLRVDAAFGTAKVRLPDGFPLDFATARTESYARPGALPVVEPSSIADDLRRRDFTINAMAIDLTPARFGHLLDPFGGRADLEQRRLRVLHPLSFVEDPTRIFRAVRFEARYHFRMDEDTEARAREALAGGALGTISPERLRAEWYRTFREPRAGAALLRLEALGALRWLDPDLRLDRPLLEALPGSLRWWRERGRDPLDAPLVWLAALLRPLGPERAVRVAEERLRLPPPDRKKLRQALEALEHSDTLPAPPAAPSEATRRLRELPPEALVLLHAAAATLPPESGEALRRTLEHFTEEWRHIKLEIRGEDLIRLGFPAGPMLGEALRATLEARLDGRVRGRDEELAFARAVLEARGAERR